MDNIENLIKWAEELIKYNRMENFYNKNHNQEHFILKNGRIWIVGNGTGKYWEYLCNSRMAQKQAREMMVL